MKCINTDWDQELIKRLKRGRSVGRGASRSDRQTGRGDRTASPNVGTRTGGRWTMEQRLALKAAREAEKRQVVQSEKYKPSSPVDSDKTRLFESPFWKIRMEILENKTRDLGNRLDNNGFRKKMKILEDRTGEMKKILTPPRRPHQELPSVKKLTEATEINLKSIEVLPEQPKSLKLAIMEDVLPKRVAKIEPNFIEFSTMTMNVWSEICGIENGESIPIMMKSMRTPHWEKFIKYYGVFERAGRLDRGILYELACDLGEKMLEHPTYKEVIGSLDQDPNESLFRLGRIMMNIYHVMALQSGTGGRTLTIQEITSKLDSGYKTIMKTKKEDDIRSNMRSSLKTRI